MVSSTPKEMWSVRLVFTSLGTKPHIKWLWLWHFCLQQGGRFSPWPLVGLVQCILAKEMAEDQRKITFFCIFEDDSEMLSALRLHKYLIFLKNPVYTQDKGWGTREKKQQGKGADSFLWSPLTRQRQWAETITQENLHCKGPKQGNKLPREVLEFPFVAILKPYLDMVLCNLLEMRLLYTGTGWSPAPLPAPGTLWSVSLERTFLYSSTVYPCRPTAQRNSIPYDHNFPLKWGTGNSQSCGGTDILKGFCMCLYSGWITSSPSWEARNAETEDWCIYYWEVFLCYWFRQKIRHFNSLKARVFGLNVYICVYLEKGMIDTLLWSYFQIEGKERFRWKQYICLYLLPVKGSRGKLINNSVG